MSFSVRSPARRRGKAFCRSTGGVWLGIVLVAAAFSHRAGAGMLQGSFASITSGSSINLTTNGPLDWVHWGTFTEFATERKSGVTPLIGEWTTVGNLDAVYQFSDNLSGYNWTDGLPTVSITNITSGVWAYKYPNPKNGGFTFSVPADTTVRRLRVYVGAYNAKGTFSASLSDNSAPAYGSAAVNNTGNGPSAVYTLIYAANSAGRLLNVTYILSAENGSLGNVTLQGAALSYYTNNNPPVVWITDPTNGQSFLSPTDLTLTAAAVDTDGSITNVSFFEGANKLGEATNAPFTMVWSNAPVGSFQLTARATDNRGLSFTSSVVECFGFTNGGSLSGVFDTSPTNVILSTNGIRDWAHWGLVTSNSYDHRAGIASPIPTFTKLGTNVVRRLATDTTSWSWTNGTPTAAATNSTTAVFIYGHTNGYELNLPAGTNSRTARIYVGTAAAEGRFQALLSDFSAPTFYEQSLRSYYNSTRRVYALTYRAASEGQTLRIRYTDSAFYDSNFANVTIQSATLDSASPVVAITSPTNGQGSVEFDHVPITAEATDWDGTVALVEFLEGTNILAVVSNAPYAMVWSNVVAGNYSLSARALDNDGTVGVSAPVNVLVVTNTPPAVNLVSPTNGQGFVSPATIAVAAEATDLEGPVILGIFESTNLLAQATNTSLAFTWSNVLKGSYSLTAAATDRHGATTVTGPVAIIVSNGPPLVSLLQPTNGQRIFEGMNFTLVALASDPDGVITNVDFFEGTNLLGTLSAPPFQFALSNLALGTYEFSASATDDDGATTVSAAAALEVVTNAPPSVSLTNPTNNQPFLTPVDIPLEVNASDPDGFISRVEFFEGTNKLGENTLPPFDLLWTNAPRGAFELTAIAHDDWTGVATSSPVVITVSNRPPSAALIQPSNGSWHFEGTNITLLADALDLDGNIALVEFFEGTNKLAEATNTPFTMIWTNVPLGSFQLLARATDNEGAITDSTNVVVDVVTNASPSVSITTPTNGQPFLTPVDISLEADASDTDGFVTLVEFFENTNKLGEDTLAPYTLVWSNASRGVFEITAVAYDNWTGLVTSAPVVITVSNRPPSVALTEPADGSWHFEGTNLVVTASATDLDGNIALVEFLSGTNKLSEATNAPFSFVWSNVVVGSYELSVRATDNEGAVTVSPPITIDVVTNAPPSVSIANPTNGQHFLTPVNVGITADVFDTDGSVTLVEFFQGTNKLGEDAFPPFSFVWTNTPRGAFELTATARDNWTGLATSAPVVITVSNHPPSIALLQPPNDSRHFEGTNIILVAEAVDLDGDLTLVEFFEGTNKLGQLTDPPFTMVWSNVPPGSFQLSARATDNDSDTTVSTNVPIEVVTNIPPSVLLTTPTNNQPFLTPVDVLLEASAFDSDGSVTLVEFFEGTNKLGEDSLAPLSFVWTNAPRGAFELTAIAHDNWTGLATSAPVVITVSNRPPSVALIEPPAGSRHFEGTNITLSAVADDLDGTIAMVEFYANTNKLGELSNAPFTMIWSNVPAGSIQLFARATDNDGTATDSTNVLVEVVTNALPVVSLTNPTNNQSFLTPVDIWLEADASDADGSITLVEFFADTNKLAEDTTAPFGFVWTNAPRGVFELTALAHDNWTGFATSAPVWITISNRPPAVSLISPTNGAGFVQPALITLAANSSDLDGFIARIEFFEGTNSVGFLTNEPFTLIWSNVMEGNYTLTAAATDNDGAVSISSNIAVVVVTNIPPTVALDSPTNGALFIEGDNILLTTTPLDVDGFIRRVEFFAGTNSLAELTNAPFEFIWTNPPAAFYSLTAAATDDYGDTRASTQVEIEVRTNTPPSVAILNPTNGEAFFSPVDVDVNATAADVDGRIVRLELLTNGGSFGLVLETNTVSLIWSNAPKGVNEIIAIATDERGGSNTMSVTFFVSNTPPTVSLLSPTNGAVFIEGDVIPIVASASDVDGTNVLVELFVGTNSLAQFTNAPYEFAWSTLVAGSYALTAITTDNDGATSSSAVVNVTVNTNQYPQVVITTPTNGSAYFAPLDLPIGVNASDADGTVILLELFADAAKLAEGTSNSLDIIWTNVPKGAHTLTAIATDERGATNISSAVNFFVSNSPPTISLTSPTNGAVFIEGDVVPIVASASDVDGTNVLIEFFVGTNSFAQFTNAPYESAWSNLIAGDYALTATTTDNDGAMTTSAVVNVTVVTNEFPTVSIASPTNGSVFFAPVDVILSATAGDLDGRIMRLELLTNGTGFGVALETNAIGLTWSNAPKGVNEIAAIATDERGASNTTSVTFSVSNTPPTVSLSSPTNGAVFIEGDVISIIATAGDLDGSVTNVDLFAGTNLLAQFTSGPFEFAWSNLTAGNYSLSARATDSDGAVTDSGVASVTVVTNQFPTISIITPTNGSVFFAPANIELSATANDVDGHIARLELLTNGVSFSVALETNAIALTWSNTPKGTHELTAISTDERGASNTVTVMFTVSNTPPTISLTSPTNGAGFIEGDVVPIIASANDVDGTNVLVEFFVGTNSVAQFTNAPYEFAWSNLVAGGYALTATATDNHGATTTSAVVSVTVNTNQFPQAAITTPTNGSAYFAPLDLPINVTATDADGAVVLLELFADATKLAEGTSNSLEIVWTNVSKGMHVLTAIATDERGATNVATAVNFIVSNTPPTISLTSPTNGVVFIEGDVIPIIASAADSDGTNVLIEFFAGTNSLAQFTNTPYEFAWSNPVAGNYLLTAVATDNDGATTVSALVSVTVVTNEYPTVSISSPTNGSVFFASADVAVSATAADADGRIVRLELLTNGGSLGVALETNAISFVWSNAPKGLNEVAVVATDDRGASNTTSVTFTVTNTPPVVEITAPTNGAWFIEGDVVNVNIEPFDADGSVTNVELFAGTNLLAQFTNGPFEFAWSNLTTGNYSLSARATDNDGAVTDSAAVNVTVVTNQIPHVAILAPTNGSVFYVPANVEVSATANDADGRIARLELLTNGSSCAVAFETNAINLVWTNAAKGLHEIIAIATDERGASNATSITFIVSNAPPFVNIFTPTNGSVFIEGDVVNITATAGDTDGTTVLVEMFTGTNSLVQFTNPPYEFAWSNLTAGDYALTATATDNDGATTTSAVINVTVNTNQFPQVAITSPTNGSAYSAPLDLPVSVSATDADGSVVLMELFANATKLAEGTSNTLNFVWTNAPKGAHVLTAIATDERGATNMATPVNFTVSNTAPTISLTSPTNGAAFIEGDVIPMTAIASDVDGTNVLVEFFTGTNSLVQFTNAPYEFAWSNLVAGGHQLTAITTDNDGSTSTSAVVNVTVSTNQFPEVSFFTPTNGQSFISRTNIAIEVIASDPDGSVRLVEVFANSNKLGELTNAPYALTWSNVAHGVYVLTSVATDDRGATNVSVPVEISVTRPIPTIILSNSFAALGEFSFSFATAEEWNYRIECRDPDNPTNWLAVTNLTGDGSTVFVTNSVSTNLQKFFRVVAE